MASKLNELPDVDRIQGVKLEHYPDPAKSRLTLQYTDQSNNWCELQMSFLDGMYLLNLLKGAQIQHGFEMPDDPFARQT